jgi:hypothetical protein
LEVLSLRFLNWCAGDLPEEEDNDDGDDDDVDEGGNRVGVFESEGREFDRGNVERKLEK